MIFQYIINDIPLGPSLFLEIFFAVPDKLLPRGGRI